MIPVVNTTPERRKIRVKTNPYLMVGALAVCCAWMAWASEPSSVTIQVSPHVIVEHSKSNAAITIHADVSYGLVALETVALQIGADEIEAGSVFPDDRGDLVAKFSRDAVLDCIAPPEATLTLVLELKDGTPLTGTETVAVR